MNRGRAFANRLLKRKQQQIEDFSLCSHLKSIKPMNTRFMEHSYPVIINNRKKDMIKQVRQKQIERQNKALFQKIATLMNKKGIYQPANKNTRAKVNKSLNQITRKRQIQSIDLQNKRFLQRLQNKRPILDTQKLKKEWGQNKNTIKRMSNAGFYLTNIKSSNPINSITRQNFYKAKYEKLKLVKSKVYDGEKMIIKVEFIGDMLKIVCDSQDNQGIKIIEIPKDQAISFLQKECEGKFQILLEKLKYDAQTEIFYIINQHPQQEDTDFGEFNPQMDRFVTNRQRNHKKTPEYRRRNKSVTQKTKKSIKQLNNYSIQLSLQKSNTIDAIPEARAMRKSVQYNRSTQSNRSQFLNSKEITICKAAEQQQKNQEIKELRKSDQSYKSFKEAKAQIHLPKASKQQQAHQNKILIEAESLQDYLQAKQASLWTKKAVEIKNNKI